MSRTYELPELLLVGSVQGVVLGDKTDITKIEDNGDWYPVVSVLDAD